MTPKEIEERLAQIRNEINTRGASMTAEELAALEAEVTQLVEERTRLAAAADTQEQRSRILAAVAAGTAIPSAEGEPAAAPTVLRSFPAAGGTEAEAEDRYGTVKYRKAFMDYVVRGAEIPAEYRADAVSKTTDVGAVIPTTVLNQIVQKLESTEFLARLATILEVDNTAFIIPVEDEYGRTVGLYPLLPMRCEIVEAAGVVYLRYSFENGEHAAIEFDRVGIMTQYQYSNDLFGEDNKPLRPTMQLLHTQNEGIINAVKNSANIRFLAKVANMLKPEDIKKERERFTEDNLSADNKSGMIIYDNKFSELKQVESKPYTVNALQMQQINENVFIHFGTNMDIVTNKYDENTFNAYYEGKIEPFAVQLSLVTSNMLFTQREQSVGNMLTWTANRLQYASNTTKLQVSTQLFDRGLINRNGVMDIWNMAHVEDGEKYYIRKEYTEVSELDKHNKEPQVIIQQPAAAGTPAQDVQEGQEGAGKGGGGEKDGEGENGAKNGKEGQKEGV